MLFPYHLSDVVVKGLTTSPFDFYTDMIDDLVAQERSYDSLPNFTAADCEWYHFEFEVFLNNAKLAVISGIIGIKV